MTLLSRSIIEFGFYIATFVCLAGTMIDDVSCIRCKYIFCSLFSKDSLFNKSLLKLLFKFTISFINKWSINKSTWSMRKEIALDSISSNVWFFLCKKYLKCINHFLLERCVFFNKVYLKHLLQWYLQIWLHAWLN